MKRPDIKALEQTLTRLPVDLKKYSSDQLLEQINSQADALLETAKPHHPCPHCGNGIAHHRLITLDNQRVIGKEHHIQNVNSYFSRLKGWMKRFKGVGTAYLPNYLAWRRLFETAKPAEEA